MLQSQIINVLPRRIIAGLWASQETRLSLSHFLPNKIQKPTENEKSFYSSHQPKATLPNFLCNEIPIRYTHILRLLSTLPTDTLQSPIVRHVAHSYLRDICKLLHPSLRSTSPRAFSSVLAKIRTSQATNLIRLNHALLTNPNHSSLALMENIQTINFGIHHLIDQHLSWAENQNQHVQTFSLFEVAQQATTDALQNLPHTPLLQIDNRTSNLTHLPHVLYRILYETSLTSLESQPGPTGWFRRRQPTSHLTLFGGPHSIGFRLTCPEPIQPDQRPPTGYGMRWVEPDQVEDRDASGEIDWRSLSGWRMSRVMAAHWGGRLEWVGGRDLYGSFERDLELLERYPVDRQVSVQTAARQLDEFLFKVSGSKQVTFEPQVDYHSVSLMAAVGHA